MQIFVVVHGWGGDAMRLFEYLYFRIWWKKSVLLAVEIIIVLFFKDNLSVL